jgi:hypothetical protein
MRKKSTNALFKEAKSPVKNLVGQRCAEGFNFGVKRLIHERPQQIQLGFEESHLIFRKYLEP